MQRNSILSRRIAPVAGVAVLLILGAPMAAASAAPSVPPVAIGRAVRITFLPPSPCRPSEAGSATRCVDVGAAVQISVGQ
jgi:hypothetical protein